MSPAGELDLMRAVAVLDHQLAAVIVVGLRQEERRRQVGADPPAAIGQEADRIVDMVAEAMCLGGVVAIEQGREDRTAEARPT